MLKKRKLWTFINISPSVRLASILHPFASPLKTKWASRCWDTRVTLRLVALWHHSLFLVVFKNESQVPLLSIKWWKSAKGFQICHLCSSVNQTEIAKEPLMKARRRGTPVPTLCSIYVRPQEFLALPGQVLISMKCDVSSITAHWVKGWAPAASCPLSKSIRLVQVNLIHVKIQVAVDWFHAIWKYLPMDRQAVSTHLASGT